MKVVTYVGYVENGVVRLPAGVVLPDGTKVYVIVPNMTDVENSPIAHIPGPRLVHPEQATLFEREVTDSE